MDLVPSATNGRASKSSPVHTAATTAVITNDGNLETMTSTPQKGFGTVAWNKLQRDLNSPSASCRVRAIRAMNSPANDNYYSNFDVTNDESTSISLAEVERSIEMPRTIEEVMKDVIVYVEVRSGTENRTSGIKSAIANLGAKVNDRLLRNTTHVVFKDGLQSTYNKAKSWNIPIVSILWIEACKKHLILMDPKDYPISNVEKFENPDLYEKTKRQKFIQPDTLMKKLQRPIPKSKILDGLTTQKKFRRRTTYTPQAMDETKVQNNSPITPASSSTHRRKTLNVNAMVSTPRSTTTSTIPDALIETKSCDAILTPTYKTTDPSTAFSTTPLIKSLSKTHIDHIRSSTSKSLLDEYNNTFSSKKTPLTDKRRTIANITMDIIKQRIENINRNASFNRSTTDFHDDSFHSSDIKATPTQVENSEKQTMTTTTTPANGNVGQLKPLKRKLFAPPSLFPENSPLPIATPQKTDKKTASTQKRKRTDLAAGNEGKMVPIEKARPGNKKPISRRSTLFFEEAPIRKINSNPSVSSSSAISSTSTMNASSAESYIAAPGLVFTSMHQSQIDFISEAVKKLGKFKLEKKVSKNTTHLVSLDNRRTVNMLRGVIRGVWILTFDWILKSVDANKWLPESDYEMRNFSKAVEINRIERQAFGRKYRMDLFRNFDCFFLAQNCSCKNLKELITLCYGKIVQNEKDARYYITEHYKPNIDTKNILQLHPNWILDSITAGKVQNLRKYIQE